MKQYITEKQFNSLSKKAQEILKQWTIERGHVIDDGKIWTTYPSLSIGQLIEFLVGRKKDIHIERFNGGEKHSHWSVSTCFDEEWKFDKERKQLCDVLWEAVVKEL